MFERSHVKEVYERISEHFSATRYKTWPVIDRFYRDMVPSGSGCSSLIGLDIGCGNGKNIRFPLQTIALDICTGFLRICSTQKGMPHVLQASMTEIPLRGGTVDYCLSIASLHHLRTPARRARAVGEMLRVMAPNAVGLVFVWAWEQLNVPGSSLSRHQIIPASSSSDNSADDGCHPQDVLVPWTTTQQGPNGSPSTEHRYYHLFRKGELEDLFSDANRSDFGCKIIESGYDRDNWYVIFKRE